MPPYLLYEPDDPNDAFWLAQTYFLTHQYSRAERLLTRPFPTTPPKPPRAAGSSNGVFNATSSVRDPKGKGKEVEIIHEEGGIEVAAQFPVGMPWDTNPPSRQSVLRGTSGAEGACREGQQESCKEDLLSFPGYVQSASLRGHSRLDGVHSREQPKICELRLRREESQSGISAFGSGYASL